ncbi:AAA+ ATPase domain [Macleaya cordata]|uniref:AAA+ ATPase domain n=1 Tax=Macleaya cordata TaxID=56857 RepID=A0A200QL63_MACCD|nr:AAA+ ATPase domain [Macleaya cordata]
MRLPESNVSREKGNNLRNPSSQRSGSERFRAKKKQKRLDAICEQVYNRNRVIEVESNEGNAAGTAGSDAGLLRRSSRVRRAPVVLDASPSPVRKRRKIDNVGGSSSVKKNEGCDDRRNDEDGLEKPSPVPNSENLDEQGSWRSRLRSRVNNVSFGLKGKNGSPRGKRKLFYEADESIEGSKINGKKMNDREEGTEEEKSCIVKTKKSVNNEAKGLTGPKSENQPTGSFDNEEEGNEMNVGGRLLNLDYHEDNLLLKSTFENGNDMVVGPNSSTQINEEGGNQMLDDLQLDEEQSGSRELETIVESEKQLEEAGGEKEGGVRADTLEMAELPIDQLDNGGTRDSKDIFLGELGSKPLIDENDTKADKLKHFKTDTLNKARIREGRRCGLCGGGTDGKPPRRMVRDSVESDNEAYGGSSASEDANYDVLDGFGDESGWLGRLLGPIHDRFGIAGVWVHQHCAVWSPEVGFIDLAAFLIKLHICGLLEEGYGFLWQFLPSFDYDAGQYNTLISTLHEYALVLFDFKSYVLHMSPFSLGCGANIWVHFFHHGLLLVRVYFAGLGCLKNVRAALCRGRSLKCSRCGRPGATIGCRVDRCPKTYHLPCARADGCVFDHRKFLIACIDHRHLFQPHGNHHSKWLKKLKVKKMKLEMRKLSHDASRKDFEVEEKWLENCGEDEEFLKREGKRLHRDLLRITPVYIGGPNSENEKLYQGWESVAGLQDVIQCMKEVVILPLLYPEFFSTLGLTPPRGVLLHGYPGTGKTLVVRALIGSCARGDKRIAYFARKGADCLGKYVGDAERQLRLLFQVAEKSQPSIIFFDEIDGLAPCRTRQQDQTHNSVVSTLLALLDGLKSRGSVIVIGATNRPEAVDPALRRPGRFDREIYFPLPSVKDRAAILSFHTQSWPKPVHGSLLKWIAQETVGFAGADLQALCTQAAMIALKRNCAWQELIMSVAEKKANNDKCPPLPSFTVEERDWLDALACAPPPCSRREAGMAANDVVSYPLHMHLIPCLLQPLSHLLVSLYLDERIWLPPSLYKAAKLIKSVLVSALEKMQMSSDVWWCHLHDLIQEADVVKEIETNLYGLLIGPSIVADSDVLDDDTNKEKEKFELHKVNLAGARANLLRNLSYSSGRASGFRVLIAGCPRSGQSHLASSLLHGFVGRVEIQKVNLATISQEGQGDAVQGVTHILMKCARAGLCIIYLPRIDLWAVETNHMVAETESEICENVYKSTDTAVPHDATRTVSQAWNTFVEQVDSTCLSASLIILATSEVPDQVLPPRISQFFTSHVSNCKEIAPREHTIPRFLVQLDGNFDCDMVINSSATELSRRLVQHYVQLIHHRTHIGNMSKEHTVCDAVEGNPVIESHHRENRVASEGSCAVTSGWTASNGNASCNDNKIQQHINCDEPCPPLLKTTGHQENEVIPGHPQDSVPRILPSRTVKGKPSLLCAISTFGYQILRYPHFSELCWTTSKLKEGPCTDINGPWKGWPFNSCVIRPKKSIENAAVAWSSSNPKTKETSGLVRGLIAVGMLAYKGAYTSVREVSFEVRKVLELLVEQINAKILGGKDRYRFLRLLSQVAFLEDMVNSWVYTLQSLELDSQMPLSNTGPTIVGSPDNPAGGYPCIPSISPKDSHEVKVQGQSPRGFVTENGGIDSIRELTNLGMLNSEVTTTVSGGPSEQMASLNHSSPGMLKSSSLAANSLAIENTSNTHTKTIHTEHGLSESNGPVAVLHEGFGSSKQSNDLAMEETVLPSKDGVCSLGESGVNMNSSIRKVSYHCNGLSIETDPSKHCVDEPIEDVNFTSNKSSGVSAVSGITCLYSCCSDCLHKLYVLIQKLLIHEKERKGSCWTVEDVHDAVSSWSVNLLSVVRKFCVAESAKNSEFLGKKVRHEYNGGFCVCPEVGCIHSMEASRQCKSPVNRVVMPMECSSHLECKSVTAKTDFCTNSQFELGLKFFFRNSVLIPSDSDKDVLFHCKFENLCLSSLIELLVMIKQPLD